MDALPAIFRLTRWDLATVVAAQILRHCTYDLGEQSGYAFALSSTTCAAVGDNDCRLLAADETPALHVGHVAAAADSDASLARLGGLPGFLRYAGEALHATPPLAAEASALVVHGAATGHVVVDRPHANKALANCEVTLS